jgi:2-polyprenyl-3-methyl-5-hydroxy-6-metoxy-1,4-benzoquinol methylase
MHIDVDAILRRVSHEFEGDRATLLERRRPWVDLFRECAPVLDVGCGDGVLLDLLASAGITCVGLERDSEKVAQARASGHSIFECDLRSLAVDPQTFGGIMAGHIIEHLQPTDAIAFVEDCFRLLREGGRLVILTPRIAHPVVVENFWLDLTHVRPYPRLLLEAMLRASGFTVIGSGELEDGMESWAVGEKRPSETATELPPGSGG